jgi:diguanylate cyclase (GGDEF)-like protein
LALWVAGIALDAASGAQSSALPVRTLTTAREAHDLSLQEAGRGLPVHLRAVVTYYDPHIDPRRPAFFVHDSSGALFVISAPVPGLRAGMLVEIDGESAAGDFAPVVKATRVKVVGERGLPATALRVSMTELMTGKFDGQWVEVEGVIRSAREFGNDINLTIAMADGTISAISARESGADYSRLVDSVVTMHADAGPLFNRKLQMTGVHLLFPNLSVVHVVEPSVADPFSLPIEPLQDLLRFTPHLSVYQRRVHLRGPVTLQWPGRSLCIQEGVEGLCAETSETKHVAAGEVVDVVGFPGGGGMTPTLTEAVYRVTGPTETMLATPITAEQALGGDHDGKLVSIEGELIGQDRAVTGDSTMVLSSGGFIFPAVLPTPAPGSAVPTFAHGSVLRVTGVCSVQVNQVAATRNYLMPISFQILLRDPKDIEVVRRASWWTAAHLLPVVAVALAVTLCALAWVAALRQRVAEQTAVIRKQNVILKDLSFQDGLTGVANRRKFDEALEVEFVRARVSSMPISLLMIDIDHFKKLNDSYGHQSGDDCLVRVARALSSASLRLTDTLARYGGEEFAVILPSCDESGAIAAAERMRAAVYNLSIEHRASPFEQRVSISVGAATLVPDEDSTPKSLIALADSALYASKQRGRNRTSSAHFAAPEFGVSSGAV